jgi:ubiquinol-cytochrome c reductase cytochrome b subunit
MTTRTGRPWTAVLRRRAAAEFPGDRLLPDLQPSYVSSWIYVFGVGSIAALIFVLGSGLILAMAGPQWFHVSRVGRFFNSVHLWSVELFFFAMVLHLWGKFMMAAWRGRRAMTWITGMIAFLGSILTALTGYLIQSNFESQWVATQAKDGLDSVGIGAWINVLDYGQMLLLHVAFLPFIVGILVVVHVLLVRRHGVVAPYSSADLGVADLAHEVAETDSGSVEEHEPAAVPS